MCKKYEYINQIEKYKNAKIIIQHLKDNGKKNQILIECPYCHKQRIINDDHTARRKNTLCIKCAHIKLTYFYHDDIENCSYFYVKDKDKDIKVLIDDEDVEKIQDCSFAISSNEHYIRIKDNSGLYRPLANYLCNYTFDETKWVVDHRNHDIYDNRKDNLFLVSQTDNQGNKKNQSNNTTGFRGIVWSERTKGWRVQIRFHKHFVARKWFKHFIDAYNYWYNEYHKYYSDCAYNIFDDKTSILKYAKIEHFDVQNGIGIGYTLYVQGCSRHCLHCQNPQTWDFNGGTIYTQKEFNDMISFFNNYNYINRLTLCGGEPLENLTLCNIIASEFKRIYPNKKLWIYTGFTYEEICNNIKYRPLLELCDVLVDGRYVDEQRDLTLKWRGSSNQRVLNIPESLKQKQAVLLEGEN